MPELKTKTAWTCLGDGIYRNTSNNRLYERIKVNGSRTWRALETTNLADARKVRTVRQSGRVLAKAGIQRSPDMPPLCLTFGEVLDLWESAGCPSRDNEPKTGHGLKVGQAKAKALHKWWGPLAVESLRPLLVDQYIAQRKVKTTRLNTGMTVQKEIAALSNALDCATRRERLTGNPMRTWPKFKTYKVREAEHCRDRMPASADVLHAVARDFFADPRSQSTGWQMLIESMTGMRTNEVIRLRLDAKPGEAGFIEGDCLHIARSKKGVNPFIRIHAALHQLLSAFEAWRKTVAPENPHWLPGKCGVGHVHRNTLTKALATSCTKLGLPMFTSHGLRAFYVTTRRSEMVPDAVIAAEIGDKTGAAIIVSTYGGLPPNWAEASAGKTGWLPKKSSPAWEP